MLSRLNEAGFIEPDGGGISIFAPICLSNDPLSKKIVSPHNSSPLKCQTTIARIFTGFPVAGHPRNVPKWVPRHSFSVTIHESSAHANGKIRESLPVLAVAFRRLFRPDKWLWHAHNVVEAI